MGSVPVGLLKYITSAKGSKAFIRTVSEPKMIPTNNVAEDEKLIWTAINLARSSDINYSTCSGLDPRHCVLVYQWGRIYQVEDVRSFATTYTLLCDQG